MARQFTRTEFYDLVWSKPMTHLAKEFVISDVALHKICRKHNIPTPPVGWWAKKEAGKAVTQTSLPPAPESSGNQISIASGQFSTEAVWMVAAREEARIRLSSMLAEPPACAKPIFLRTISQLRKAKVDQLTGMVTTEGPNLIRAKVAPGSIDRVEAALSRIIIAAELVGASITSGDKGAAFRCGDVRLSFSVTEGLKREKHALTAKELAEDEARRKRNQKRWGNHGGWSDDDLEFDFTRFQRPQWDYHPTGSLALELDEIFLLGQSPRRSFRDAKIQRLELMAPDIAVGVMVYAAAVRADKAARDRAETEREARRRIRETALRQEHIAKRRMASVEEVLQDIAALNDLRQLVKVLDTMQSSDLHRVSGFLNVARRYLEEREAALSPEGLEERFAEAKLFGADDDYDFRPPTHYGW